MDGVTDLDFHGRLLGTEPDVQGFFDRPPPPFGHRL